MLRPRLRRPRARRPPPRQQPLRPLPPRRRGRRRSSRQAPRPNRPRPTATGSCARSPSGWPSHLPTWRTRRHSSHVAWALSPGAASRPISSSSKAACRRPV
ncbi:MAG: hypothetical protein E6I52_09850 [Chloroflexi bacterium]|nr:MAG: hypothetical protein E6I52_09850 [Chloroflexota bacterium]